MGIQPTFGQVDAAALRMSRMPDIVITLSSSVPSIAWLWISFLLMAFPAYKEAPFIPDGLCDAPPPQTPYPMGLTLVIFFAVFAVLQWAWSEARGTVIERWVIHDLTVQPAAMLVQLMTPAAHARAVAASIKATGGGLNILNGCEGTEIMFLLVAASLLAKSPIVLTVMDGPVPDSRRCSRFYLR
jgi:exosortase/archaeosortase